MKSTTLLVALCALLLNACDKVPEPEGHTRPAVSKEPEAPEPPDLVIEEVKPGEGTAAKNGDKVFVHYTGKLAKNGKQFDSSVGKKPLDFVIGEHGVIEGWEKGITGMKPGGKRKLTIPSRLAYKDEGHPPNIPPKATLVFDVELVRIGDEPAKEEKEAAAKDEKAPAKKDEKKDEAKKEPAKKEEPKKEPAKKEPAKKP